LKTHGLRGALVRVGLLALALGGCADEDAPAFEVPALHDLTDAPEAIQRAAQAVVRIRSAQSFGTGAFISATGRLMTNDHVLGATVCPVEGCWVELSFDHQRGEAPSDARLVRVVPEHVDVGLDMAILQVYEDGQKLSTPHFLSFASKAPSAMVGGHVRFVGHPHGRLKKWSDGAVVSASGAWFESTAFSLPGMSGSPVLDERGQIVGLLHRGGGSLDSVTSRGIDAAMIGTSSSALLQAMEAPLPPQMIAAQKPLARETVIAHHEVLLNGHVSEVIVDGQRTEVLSLLAEACDVALLETAFESLEDLEETLAPCHAGLSWIECREDAIADTPGSVCPPQAERARWVERYEGVNARLRALNGMLELDVLSFGIAALADDSEQGDRAAAARLERVLREEKPLFDFSLGIYLAAFGVDRYEGLRTVDMVRDYASVPYFERSAGEIASAALWLSSSRTLPRDEALGMLWSLYRNPEVNLGAKLRIEEWLYQAGELR